MKSSLLQAMLPALLTESFQKHSYLLLAMQFEYKIKLKVNIKKTCTEKKNSKKMTKIVQNTFKRVDFPHPLSPISVQNYL